MENVRCGCGRAFRACSFWGAVGEEAFGGWDHVHAESLAELDRTIRPRTLPLHWMPWLRPRFAEGLSWYAAQLTRLYAAIARVSGAKTIIDTSKDPNFAWLLHHIPGCDVHIIHLVRDSRAVAYSRNKRLASSTEDQKFMDQLKPIDTAPRWLAWNLVFHTFPALHLPYMRLSYESVVANPQKALGRCSIFADDSLVLPPSQLIDGKVKLGGHHIFSGNPMRRRAGWLDIALDDEWQTMLSTRQFMQVTAITLPLLGLYGYRVVPAARRKLSQYEPGLR
jgi:hypothetical protein